jgi:hypothetical protein
MRTPPEAQDRDLPPLGAPIKPAAAPAPAPTPVSPGIMRKPDGKLITDLPRPAAPSRAYTPAAKHPRDERLEWVRPATATGDPIEETCIPMAKPQPAPSSILSPEELTALDEVRAFLGKELRW